MKSLEVEFDEGTGCDNTEIEIEITTNDFKPKQDLNLATSHVQTCEFDVIKKKEIDTWLTPLANVIAMD